MRRAAPAALTVAALTSLAVPATASPTATAPQPTCESTTRCVVPDPRGDAFQGSAEARRLTDLADVRYTTAAGDDGRVRVRVTWPRLLDGTRGARTQELGISMTARDGRFWSVVVDNAERLEAYELRSGAEDTVRVPAPEEWSVRVRPGEPGRRGVLDVSFSTEWVGATRPRFDTWAETGYARDETRRTPPLTLGGS